MSPILKRDVHEQLRQAKRLAQALAGTGSGSGGHDPGEDAYEYTWEQGHGDSGFASSSSVHRGVKGHIPTRSVDVETYTSGSHPRRGIGVGDVDVEGEKTWREGMTAERRGTMELVLPEGQEQAGKQQDGDKHGPHQHHHRQGSAIFDADIAVHADEDWPDGEGAAFLPAPDRRDTHPTLTPPSRSHRHMTNPPRIPDLPHIASPESRPRGRAARGGRDEVKGPSSPLADLRNLLVESTPSLLFSLVGLVFTGELLEHLARWRVFRRVDELFILVPMLGNLKGNLEMCLSARLGTSANIGELDHRRTRRALLVANMTLLGLQALLIACLAAGISFVLGLLTIHRLGDADGPPAPAIDPGMAVGEQEWHEGYTRPGWKQLVMVLATGMGAAGLSSAVLGSFMSSVIVSCRWLGVDPDNITPPVASCLGDLLTLFILALIGTALVGVMDTPIPLLAVILMGLAAAWFTKRVMRNEWVRGVARGGWVPLIGAMCISSGTGMVLDHGVERYRGFALLAISMTGLTGSIGAIHANRLSTSLHTNLHPASLHPRPNPGLRPLQRAITLYLIAFPCEALFLGFVSWAGWIDLSLGWAGWACFAVTTALSLCISHALTLFFWSKDLDPDSYTLPIHSALVDFLGQLLLMLAYEICSWQGLDVQARLEG